jgi:hypothetical protein
MLVLLAVLAGVGLLGAAEAHHYAERHQRRQSTPPPAPDPQITPSSRPYLGPRRPRTAAQRLKRHQLKNRQEYLLPPGDRLRL